MRSFSTNLSFLLFILMHHQQEEIVHACQSNAVQLIESDPFQLSSHILDITRGAGANGIEVRLYKESEESRLNQTSTDWIFVEKEFTDSNGRIKTFLERRKNPDCNGIYKLVFLTEPYFISREQATFYPQIEVVFNISEPNHYHVPITLSNFGYSTYRGT